MKRHPCLQPLSREHHLGLVLSRRAASLADDDAAGIAEHWQALTDYLTTQIPAHFATEKECIADVIFAKLPSDEAVRLANEMLKQHNEIEALLQISAPTAADVRKLAQALHDHIRFEEREVFPVAQAVLDNNELQALYAASSDAAKK
ncbi:hypothetical protein B0181_06215 [Moraxella caviae]|uniref:Uncharacterized conserved protein n=1 Tax=Moraxella caviae TaxID=34060 RepID=A0A1T0A1T7_9GAMM|nr:hemerythrin domain-containing protein [Moraxella caviae]OOR89645.1 hypothetical protein B0181_06215 [Moraxella caviae]STZ10245.1 Uncharacterized conserved protein [Moraxella caviae]